MKRIISLLMAAVLAVTALCFSTAVFAADKNCFSVTMTGRQYNSVVQGTMEDINKKRANNGLESIVLDDDLTSYAQDRAAEIMIYVDENDEFRPDGTTVDSGVPENVSNYLTDCFLLSDSSRRDLTKELSVLSEAQYSDVKSIGLALFGKNNIYVAYVIITDSQSDAAFTEYQGQPYKKSIKMLESRISDCAFDMIAENNVGTMNLKMYFLGSGAYDQALVIPNSQLTYSSSDSKVFKIKNSRGFIKKKGKATISVKSKSSGKLLARQTAEFTSTNIKLKVTKSYSKKKGTAFVQWQTNVSNADGYQIQYSTDKNFKKGVKTVTLYGYNHSKKTIKKLKSRKTYYIRIRAYVDQGYGEKVYSNWSSKRSVKIK